VTGNRPRRRANARPCGAYAPPESGHPEWRCAFAHGVDAHELLAADPRTDPLGLPLLVHRHGDLRWTRLGVVRPRAETTTNGDDR
jgi:hypothetical protein